MRRRLVWSVVLALAAAVWAPRAEAWWPVFDKEVSVMPTDGPLPTNGRIVLDIFGAPLGNARDIEEHHPQLRAANETVALQIAEKQANGTNLFVLVADRPLQPRTAYALVFDPPLEGAPNARWTTTPSADREPPRWLSRPKADPPVSRRYRRSSGSYVDIDVNVGESAMIRVDARRHGDGRRQRYLLFPTYGRIRFRQVAPGHRYSLKLTAIDAAGNESKAPGPPIEVSVPARESAP